MSRIWPYLLLLAAACGCSSPIRFRYETRRDPPNRIWIAQINLSDPRVRVRVAPGGADPDGPGPWQTTLLEPTKIAAREGFDLVVNGDFFDARNIRDVEGAKSKYRADVWASVIGPAMTDGKTWSVAAKPRACLVEHRDGRVSIEEVVRPGPEDWEVISGNVILVADGAVVPQSNKAKHPRTAVGLNKDGSRLTLMVVDGRKPGIAAGMDYGELAVELLKLGCYQALNLDGGGSSVMARRDRFGGGYRILNAPTDGHERPVANVLGVIVAQK